MFGYTARGGMFAALLSFALFSTGWAKAYDAFDAQYVTSLRDPAVLSYIVCLEREVSATPRSMALDQAIAVAEGKCGFEASRIGHGAGQPSIADIRLMLLECGFRPGDASPDMGCGAGSATDAATDVSLAPRTIAFGKWVEGIAFDGTSIWAAESGQRTLGRANLATGTVSDHPKVGRLPLDVLPDPVEPGVIALLGTDNKVVSVSGRGALATIASLTACPVQMVTLGIDIFVLGQPDCSSDKTIVTRVDGKVGLLVDSTNLGEWGQALVAQGSDIWVGHVRGAALSILDARTLNYGKLDLPGTEVWSLAADAKSVYAGGRVSGTDSGTIVRVDAGTWAPMASFSPTELVLAMTLDNGYLVAVGDKGTIWVLAADDLSLKRRIDLGKGEFRTHTAMVVNGALLVSAQQVSGENGAVYVLDTYLSDLGLPANAIANAAPGAPGRAPPGAPQRGVPGAGPGTTPVATAPAGPGSGPAIIRRPSGTSAPTATAPTTPTTPTTGPAPRRGPPTATTPPTATPPATNMGPQRRPPTTTAPPTTATPPAGAGPQRSGGFPIAAGSFGSNVRNAPSASATKIGSTGNGQTLTLLETGANTYQGYPWFKIRMPDGTSGYQWGGGTCYFGAPIAGLKGACPFVATASPSGPTRSTSAGPTRPTAGTTTTGPVRPAGPVRPGGPGPNGGPQVATGNPNIGTAMGGGPNPNSFGADGQEDGAPMGRYADYSALDPQAVDACNTANPADVDYYACLDGKMDDFVASGGTVSLPEPRIYRSYNQLGQAVLTACSNANPTNAKYYDCLDGELRKLVPPGTDLRSFDDYSTLADGSPTGNGAYQYCATQGNSNTPAYFDCLDQQTGRYRVATETAQMAPAPGGGPDPNAFGADGQEDNPEIDPNAQNDYSMVSDADEHDCDVNNPADGDYYICMNGRKAAVLANGGPGDVDLNPLHMPDGSSIPNGLYQSCAQSYGEGSQDYKSCVDSGVVGMAIGELNTTDSRKNDDHSLVTRDTLNTCWAQTMPDIGALLDCVGVAQMQAEHANAQAGGPDPNAFGADGQEDSSAEDYSMVGAADQQYCDLNNPNDADYYACMKAAKDAVLAGGAPSQGTPQLADETPQMGADLNPQNDEQAIRDAAASSYPDLSDEERAGCETYGLGTQSYWDCLEAVRTSKAEAQNDQTSYGDPAASDNGQSSDGQVYAAPSGDGSARVSDLISQECQSQHGDTGGQCESDVGACAASYPDLGGSDFEACVGEYGW